MHEVFEAHLASGNDITAVCADVSCKAGSAEIRFVQETSDSSKQMLFASTGQLNTLPSIEVYIIRKTILLELIDWSRANGELHFHRGALAHYLNNGGTIGLYVHKGYTAHICSVSDYYSANMDMLNQDFRRDLFNDEHPIYTRGRSSVSILR